LIAQTGFKYAVILQYTFTSLDSQKKDDDVYSCFSLYRKSKIYFLAMKANLKKSQIV